MHGSANWSFSAFRSISVAMVCLNSFEKSGRRVLEPSMPRPLQSYDILYLEPGTRLVILCISSTNVFLLLGMLSPGLILLEMPSLSNLVLVRTSSYPYMPKVLFLFILVKTKSFAVMFMAITEKIKAIRKRSNGMKRRENSSERVSLTYCYFHGHVTCV